MLHVRNILVAKDLSDSSEQALRVAHRIADRTGARLHLVHVRVVHPDPLVPDAYPEDHDDRVRAAMDDVLTRVGARESGSAQAAVEVVQGAAVAPALVEYARANPIDLMVTGTHGRRGFRHMILGSVAEEVVRTAPCPVLTVRRSEDGTEPALASGAPVLVPVDFSDHALRAVRLGRETASAFGSPLVLAHVVEETLHPAFYNAGAFSIYDLQPDVEERALRYLERAFDSVPGPDVPATFRVTDGHAAVEIVRLAQEMGAGLIVMTTHGLTGLAHIFVGSVAEHVVRASPVPVLTLKSFGREPLDTAGKPGAG